MTTQKPEALRLADKYEVEGFLQDHRFAQNEWCNQAAAELRSLYAGNAALRTGYEATRYEIESLRARVQELGQMLRENRSKRVVALEAENLGLLHALAAEQDANADLRQQLESIGAGGVEPLRKADHFRDATQMVPQGWKLVPVEPTLAMIRAGRDTPLAGEADDDSPEDYRCVYRAMLAAAPQPPADHLRGATEMIGANEAPARKPLTDRQIQEIWCSARNEGNQIGPFWFAHAIERAHGITQEQA